MLCKFNRQGGLLVCECCGSKITTDQPAERVKMNCKGGEGCSKDYPSIFQMAQNTVTSAIDYIKDGMKNASDEEIARRLSICEECPLYNKEQRRCTDCGCFVSIKTVARSARCPKDKW